MSSQLHLDRTKAQRKSVTRIMAKVREIGRELRDRRDDGLAVIELAGGSRRPSRGRELSPVRRNASPGRRNDGEAGRMIQTVPLAVRIGWAYACAGNLETALQKLRDEASGDTAACLDRRLDSVGNAAGAIEEARKVGR